jgi:hypothetical protein
MSTCKTIAKYIDLIRYSYGENRSIIAIYFNRIFQEDKPNI